jgi:hypothetical protein
MGDEGWEWGYNQMGLKYRGGGKHIGEFEGKYTMSKNYARKFSIFVIWRGIKPSSEDCAICCFKFDIPARHVQS